MVLESAEHGPALCVGVVLTSLPPQCGDVPLTKWNWDWVDGESRMGGTTWGQYHVVGTYDGKRFGLTQRPGPPAKEPGDIPRPIGPSCPTPEDGWRGEDPARTTDEAMQRALEAAGREPDFSGAWVFYTAPQREAYQDPRTTGLNLTFTGDLERHETELRKIWGGALCVARHEHTLAELESLMNIAADFARERGIQVLSMDGDELRDRTVLGVVWADDEDQAAMDARFGKNTILLEPRIRPLG